MIIDIPKEIKIDEHRVSMTPAGVNDLVTRGHKVLLEDHAGEGSGITNQNYLDQGAKIVKLVVRQVVHYLLGGRPLKSRDLLGSP